jgi:hypothetical protein
MLHARRDAAAGDAMTLRSITGRRAAEERARALAEIGELESLRAVCPACGAGRGQRCYPGSRVHIARCELRSEELEGERRRQP